jgi:hypothetical protein
MNQGIGKGKDRTMKRALLTGLMLAVFLVSAPRSEAATRAVRRRRAIARRRNPAGINYARMARIARRYGRRSLLHYRMQSLHRYGARVYNQTRRMFPGPWDL